MNTSLESGGSGCGSGGSGENSGGGGNSLSRYLKSPEPHQEEIQCNALQWANLESQECEIKFEFCEKYFGGGLVPPGQSVKEAD